MDPLRSVSVSLNLKIAVKESKSWDTFIYLLVGAATSPQSAPSVLKVFLRFSEWLSVASREHVWTYLPCICRCQVWWENLHSRNRKTARDISEKKWVRNKITHSLFEILGHWPQNLTLTFIKSKMFLLSLEISQLDISSFMLDGFFSGK